VKPAGKSSFNGRRPVIAPLEKWVLHGLADDAIV
jgi:hypothetical protein